MPTISPRPSMMPMVFLQLEEGQRVPEMDRTRAAGAPGGAALPAGLRYNRLLSPARVAQLDRASARSRGWGFESLRAC